MTSIENLEQHVAELAFQLREAEKELLAARIGAAPFKVGEVVEVRIRRSRGWEEGLIRKIEPRSSWTTYRVSVRKINGEWSIREQGAYPETVRKVNP